MTNPASMMTLAPELHLIIAKHLEFPDNVKLKLSTPYFHELIKPLSFGQLVHGCYQILGLATREWRPCNDCHCVRPGYEFDSRDHREHSCIECKFKKKRPGYQIGDMIKLGYGHVLCRDCEEFKGAIPGRVEGLCEPCWFRFEHHGYRSFRFRYRYDAEEDKNPAIAAFYVKKHISKLKTSSAWLHHDIWCTSCAGRFSKCQWTENHRVGERTSGV